jgi:AAA domain
VADAPRIPLMRCMADIEPEAVDWLWYPYIPRGKLTLLEGDPGAGKTWLALAITAALTRGRVPVGGPDAATTIPATVLYLTGEDGLAETLRPRLDSAGADVSRAHVLVGWQQDEVQRAISLSDLGPLETAIEELRPALMVIDPIQAYMGASVDMHRANETRPVLMALAALGEQYGCTPFCIRHLSKAAQDRAIYRGLGSIDFTAAARSILLAGHDPQDKARRILAHEMSSLAALGPSLVYELREGMFLWAGESPLMADDLLRPQAMDEERSAVDEAQDFLRQILADGPQPAKGVIREAKKAGIYERTLDRAKKGLVEARKVYAPGQRRGEGAWMWQLVEQERQEPYRSSIAPLNESRNSHKNPLVASGFKERQVAPLNDTVNAQANQEAISDFLERQIGYVGGEGVLERHACAGCQQPFMPLKDDASKTLCRMCQAELRRGGYGDESCVSLGHHRPIWRQAQLYRDLCSKLSKTNDVAMSSARLNHGRAWLKRRKNRRADYFRQYYPSLFPTLARSEPMGGWGSTRWGLHQRKLTAEECLGLDLRLLLRERRQRRQDSLQGTITWDDQDRPEASASCDFVLCIVDLHEACLELTYYAGQQLLISRLALIRAAGFGGRHGGFQWFGVCPEARCGRQVRKVYCRPDVPYFACATCHNLTYRSCQEAHKYDRGTHALLAKMWGINSRELAKRMQYQREGVSEN